MGSLVSSQMNSVMEKNLENMAAMQNTMLERQIQMNNYMRERQMAMQLASQREMFYNWWCPFYALVTPLCIAGFVKTKNPGPLVPVIPISFLFGYQADIAMGNKMDRIRAEADKILSEEMGTLSLPGPGLPSIDALDERRQNMKK